MAADRLKKYAGKLKNFRKLSQKNRKKFLKKYLNDGEFLKCICECAKNILNGVVPLSVTQKKSLRQRRNSVRRLASKKTSVKDKKRIIQRGGFLSALISPILSILGGLLTR